MGVSGRRADFCVAHHRFSRVFRGSGFGEVRGEEVAGAADGDVGQSGVFEGAFPASAFDGVGERVSLAREYELAGLALPASDERPESEPRLVADGNEPVALLAFWFDEPEASLVMAGAEPVGHFCIGSEALELPHDLDSVHAVDGGELFGQDGESFGLSHAGLEHDVPHEAPHFAVVVGICQVAVFATLGVECGLRRLGRLSGFEDLGGLQLIARRCCGERRVRWDEAFADRCVEHLPESEIVVVDGFASVFLGEFGAHSVDGGGGYSVESHSADDAADGVAVGSVGFEGAGFDVGRDGVEPSVYPHVEGGDVCEGQIAFSLKFVELGLEFLSGGGLGLRLRLDPAASSGSWIDAGALLRVPDSVVVAPFASASVGSTGVLLLCHGLQASSFSCGRGQTLGQTFRAEIGGLGRKTCIGMFSAPKTPKAATPSNSKGLRPLSVERMTGIEPA